MSAWHQGMKVNERYELNQPLGVDMSQPTWLARDTQSKHQVVIRRLELAKVEDWKDRELFERQVAVLRQVKHPRIPTFVEAFELEDGRTQCLVQEYVEGTNLAMHVESEQEISEEELRDIFLQILDILEFLGNLQPPVVHRNVQPTSIIQQSDGTVYLTSFGSLQNILRTGDGGSTVVGTNGFIPPEQLVGKATPASDLYALALTLVQVATRERPGDLPIHRMKPQVRDVLKLPLYLVEVLDQMVEPSVHNRLDDYALIRQALEKQRLPRAMLQASASRAQRRTEAALQTRDVALEPVIQQLALLPPWYKVGVDDQSVTVRTRRLNTKILRDTVPSTLIVSLFLLFISIGDEPPRPEQIKGWIAIRALILAGFFAAYLPKNSIVIHPYGTLAINDNTIQLTVSKSFLTARNPTLSVTVPTDGLLRCAYYQNEMRVVFHYKNREAHTLMLAKFIPKQSGKDQAEAETEAEADARDISDWLRMVIQARLVQNPRLKHLEWTIHD